MNITLGIVVVLLCTTIQSVTIVSLRSVLRQMTTRRRTTTPYLFETAVFSVSVTALFIGMLVQVFVWALVFVALGELSDLHTSFYFSLVNFTTLGYGDIVLSEDRAILGPLEASNGVLMLGMSTSYLYSVAQRLKDD